MNSLLYDLDISVIAIYIYDYHLKSFCDGFRGTRKCNFILLWTDIYLVLDVEDGRISDYPQTNLSV